MLRPSGTKCCPCSTLANRPTTDNVLPFGDKVTALRKGIQAPFGTANAPLDPVSEFRRSGTPRKLCLLADRGAQDIKVRNRRQHFLRGPGINVDQLEHVSPLACRRAGSLQITSSTIGAREVQDAVSDCYLITAISSSAVADRQLTESAHPRKSRGAGNHRVRPPPGSRSSARWRDKTRPGRRPDCQRIPRKAPASPGQMDFHTVFLSACRSSRHSLTLCRRLPLTQDKRSSCAG